MRRGRTETKVGRGRGRHEAGESHPLCLVNSHSIQHPSSFVLPHRCSSRARSTASLFELGGRRAQHHAADVECQVRGHRKQAVDGRRLEDKGERMTPENNTSTRRGQGTGKKADRQTNVALGATRCYVSGDSQPTQSADTHRDKAKIGPSFEALSHSGFDDKETPPVCTSLLPAAPANPAPDGAEKLAEVASCPTASITQTDRLTRGRTKLRSLLCRSPVVRMTSTGEPIIDHSQQISAPRPLRHVSDAAFTGQRLQHG